MRLLQARSGDRLAVAGDETLRIDRRKALVTLLLAVLLSAGALGLLGQLAHWGKLLDALRRADKAWFPLCAAGMLLAYVGYVLGYRDIARAKDGPDLDYWTVLRVVVLGFGASVLGSAPGTLALDFWALERAGEDVHQAARRVLALNTLEWAVLGAFAAIAAGAKLAGLGERAPLAITLAWATALPLCLAAAAWITSGSRGERLKRPPDNARPPLWRKVGNAFADAIGAVVLLREVVRHPRRYALGLVAFPLYWLGDMLTLYAALRAFGVSIGPAALVLGYTTTYVLTALPLPAGGSGGIEAALAGTLHLVGAPFAPALLAAFVYRIFVFWLPLLPALAALPTVKRLRDELPRVATNTATLTDGCEPGTVSSSSRSRS
jgi:uncharacterized membrane protein YbhN (UPF0104 family)